MKKLLSVLTYNEKEFVCFFANHFLKQIPYIDSDTIEFLNIGYFIKTLKKNTKLSDKGNEIKKIILDKHKNLS